MNPLQNPLVRIVGLLVVAVIALLVLRDANGLRERGAKLTPWLWAVLTVIACGLAVPIYLILRRSLWSRQLDGPGREGARASGEAREFSLTCECGKRIALTEASAGSTVRCACNRTLQVPSLSELRKMARAAEP
jgi:hypothetical protein